MHKCNSSSCTVCHGQEDARGGTIPPQAQDGGLTATLVATLKDHPRVCQRVAVAPRGSLVAIADNLGRVLLLDAKVFAVVRLWKVRS